MWTVFLKWPWVKLKSKSTPQLNKLHSIYIVHDSLREVNLEVFQYNPISSKISYTYHYAFFLLEKQGKNWFIVNSSKNQPGNTCWAPFAPKPLTYFFYQGLKPQHRGCELYKLLLTSLWGHLLVLQAKQSYKQKMSGFTPLNPRQ